MPYVNIRITPGATPEKKAELIRDVTDSLVRVLDKKPEQTHIVIDEIAEENWGFAGVPTNVYRRAAAESEHGPV